MGVEVILYCDIIPQSTILPKVFMLSIAASKCRPYLISILASTSKLGINLGEKNGMWKGSNVGYLSLHDYVKYHLPKSRLCQMCKKVPSYDLANISGEYKRDLNDWQWLCCGCHMLSDGRLHSRDNKTGKFIPNQQKEIVVSSQ